ncbi:MAG: hypothetical protein E7523_00125 [Ruminococcaceae bacterium]|nr:hypothetical protein [Oscillospiraceae bacterium]
MKKIRKSLSFALSLLMLLSVCSVGAPALAASVVSYSPPVYSQEELHAISEQYEYGLTEEEISAILDGKTTLSDVVESKEEDVTVIVQLSANGVLNTVENAVSDGVFTASAVKEQASIQKKQATVQSRLEKNVFDGEDVEVLYSYTLIANAFAITAKKSQIDEIAAVRGVQSVYTAPLYQAIPTDADGEIEYSEKYFTGSDNTTAYKGTGTTIAVIDTGLDLSHEAFSNAVSNPKLDFAAVGSAIENTHAYKNSVAGGNVVTTDDVYHSAKIPFAYNYADAKIDVSHDYDDQGDHGTHVAGIAAGYATDSEGKVLFEGVAPDAQIVVLKVFGDRRAGDYGDIMAAVEDAVALGVDVINLSLGSWAGFTYAGDYPDLESSYQSAAQAGIVVACAAGNDYSAAQGSLYGNNLSLAANPDNGIIGSPASYDDNFAVASAASNEYMGRYLLVGDRKIAYTNNATNADRNIEKFLGETIEYAVLRDGNGNVLTGKKTDFDNFAKTCGIKGKIAVVLRGETFTETVANAQSAGAIGLIVCDNVDGSLVTMMENDSVSIPALFISKADGEHLFDYEATDNSMFVSEDSDRVENQAKGTMSDFSSWGVTADLKLKPEITAYGGMVYSTRNEGEYGLMSGTSMATPYIAGVSALVAQKYAAVHAGDAQAMLQARKNYAVSVMMSTASPVIENETGVRYSPRKQGAGLVNIDAALSSYAHITVDGSVTPKIDIGDDKAKNGVYDLTFNVVNDSAKELVFSVDATVQTEQVEIQDISYQTQRIDPEKADAFIETGLTFANSYADRVYYIDELKDVKFMSGLPYDLTEMSTVEVNAENNRITVPAEGSVTVTVTVTLGEEARTYMDENFENGIYVEGFILLTSETEGQPDLTVPYMGFYGDWTMAPALDEGTWEDIFTGKTVYPQMDVSTGAAVYHSTMFQNGLYPLGIATRYSSPFDLYQAGIEYQPDIRNAFGGEDGIHYDAIGAELALLRNARAVRFTVTDVKTGEVYAEETREYVRKSYYYSDSVGMVNGGYFEDDLYRFDGVDQNTGKDIPDGTTVRYDVEVILDYGNEEEQNNKRNTFSFVATHDVTPPELKDVKVYIDEQTGDVMADVTVSDNHFVDEILYSLTGYSAFGAETYSYGASMMLGTQPGETIVDTLNITEMMGWENIVTPRSLRIQVDDMCSQELVNPDPSDPYGKQYYYISFYDNVKLMFPSGVMSVGDTKFVDLNKTYGYGLMKTEPYLNHESGDNIKFDVYEEYYFSSSDPDVASINTGGLITAKSPGYTTLTVTTEFGKVVSSCRIRVIENVLQAQIDATPVGGTLVIEDGDLIEAVTIDKDMTLDLNGTTLTGADGTPAIKVTGGQVTITNGSIKADYSMDEMASPVLVDILYDNTPAVKVTGGTVTLDRVNITGATASYDGKTFVAGSAVKLTYGAELYIRNSNLYGLYAVNNTDSEEPQGGDITIASGHLEGLLGSVAVMDNVYGEDGSAFVDATNLLAGDTADYFGTVEGTPFSQTLMAGYVVTAREIAENAIPAEGVTVTYDAASDCAVVTLNANANANVPLVSQYLQLPVSGFDASANKSMVVTYKWEKLNNNVYPNIGYSTPFVALDPSHLNNEGFILSYAQAGAELKEYNLDLGQYTKWSGATDNIYFWPAVNTPNDYGIGCKAISKTETIAFRQLVFFANKAQVLNFTVANNIASTNNLLVANAQTYNTKQSLDGNTLFVNVTPDNVSDGTYKWVPTELSLYTRTPNGDGTNTDTLVATKAVAYDENGEINTEFTVSDPNAIYVVKCDFDLVLTADSSDDFFAAQEKDILSFVETFSSMFTDAFLLDELETALEEYAMYLIYYLREGCVERDARHYDCPLSSANVPTYYPDYPNMIGRNVNGKFATWTAMWDSSTLPQVIGNATANYLISVATLLGDEKMQMLMADLESTLPENVWNSLDVNYRVGNYGCEGSLPTLRTLLNDIDAQSATQEDREKLAAMLSQIAESIVDLYENAITFSYSMSGNDGSIKDYSDPSASTTLYQIFEIINIVDESLFALYNDRHDDFGAAVSAIADCYRKVEETAAALKYASLKSGLLSALTNYEDEENTSALLSLYFDENAIENSEKETGISDVFEMNANYDGYITYVLNGGKNSKENKNGYTTALPVVFAEPTRAGYTFGGWYTSADFAENTRITGTDATTNGDLTLYAKWIVNKYTITYMVNDEVFDIATFDFDAMTSATEKTVNVPGFVFNYWYEDYPHNEYQFGNMPASDVVLYANLDYVELNDIDFVDGVYSWQFDDGAPVRLVIDRSCTIDFNGKVITNMDDMAALLITDRAVVTIKNAVIAPQAYSDISAENCSVRVTDNAEVTFENCYILGAKDAQNSYYVGNAVDVDYGNVTLKNSVLAGMYAVKNDKGDEVYYDCQVDVENSILLGVAAPVSQMEAMNVIGEQINASQILAEADDYAETRFVAAFNVPEFTWEYESAYAQGSSDERNDILRVNAPTVTYTLPDGSVVAFTASDVTADGVVADVANGSAAVEIPADYETYNHSVQVAYECNVNLADTAANDLQNNDDMVLSAMKNEINAFDSLVARYEDLLATWANRQSAIKDKFYQFDNSALLKVYLANIRKRLENIGGAQYTGNQDAGEGLAPRLRDKIEAYKVLTDDAEKFAWLMQNKAEVIYLTVEMDDDFNSVYVDCVLLNGLSTVYYGDDYTQKLGYVEEVCNRSNSLRYTAESLPAVAENEYMAAKDRDAFIANMFAATPSFVDDAVVNTVIDNAVQLKDSFATYTVVYELYDEYLDETTSEIFVIMAGEDVPVFTPEAVEGRTFTGWTQAPVQFPITKISYSGSLLKDSYTITFKAEGSEDIVKTAKYGDDFTDIPAVPERAHYDQVAPYWDVTSFEGISGDMVVNAVYTPNVYKVIFKAEGSEDVEKTVTYGEDLTDIPAVPERAHYEQVAPYWDVDSFEGISGDMIVNAVYTPDVYEIVFKAEGSTDIVKTVTYGENFTDIPAVPERAHYDQVAPHWDVDSFDNIGSDIIVNAVYTPNVYKVVFKAEDSEDIVKNVTYGDDLTDIPAVPERTHYNQVAPYWDVTSFEGISSDITVNAVYTANVYNVTWVVEGVETSEEYTYNTTPVYTGELAKACDEDVYYVFDSWTPAVAPATKDIVYTAVFKSVPKETSDVAVPADLTATYGSTLASINLPMGFVWKDATLAVGNVGVNEFTAIYTPVDTEHYLVEEVTVQITVTKATPVVTAPSVDGVTGHKLSEFALPAGFAWVDGNTVLGAAGTATYTAVYTPEDTQNYNTVTVNVTVHVVIPAQYCAVYGHDYSGIRVVAPTCTEDGYTVHTCAMCGNEYSDTVVEKLGHSYEDTVVAPTCTEKGYTKHTCSVCGDTYNDTFVAENGHSYTDAVRSEPTCTDKGVRVYTCKNCSHSYTESIPALGHTDADGDGHCDRCSYQICDHMCHKSGIAGIFWKLIRFFNKLFKRNQFCECGYQHW